MASPLAFLSEALVSLHALEMGFMTYGKGTGQSHLSNYRDSATSLLHFKVPATTKKNAVDYS